MAALFLVALIASLCCGVVWAGPEAAEARSAGAVDALASSARLYVLPQSKAVVVGSRFSLEVYADLADLAAYGVEAQLSVHPAVVGAVSLTADTGALSRVFEAAVDRSTGAIRYQAGLDVGADPVSGLVRLFSVELDALLVTPETWLVFDSALVALSGGESLTPATEPGKITILAPTATPTLTRTPTATATPSPTFTPTSTLTPTASPTRFVTQTPSPTATCTSTIGPTPQATATLQTSSLDLIQDTFLDEWEPGNEHGGDYYLKVRSGGVQRGLVQFALRAGALEIPAGATVTEARLLLYNTTSGRPAIGAAAYGVKREWIEKQATWLKAHDGDDWEAPGASDPALDRDELPQDSLTLEGVGWYIWDVTELAQRWAQDSAANRGILIISQEGPSAEYRLASREYGNGSHPPELLITWRPGQPVEPTPSPTATPSGLIHGRIFEDLNGDHAYQSGEGLPGITVQINRQVPQPVLRTGVSDAQGGYRFGDLLEGWYSLNVDLPAGYRAVGELPASVRAVVDAPVFDIELSSRLTSRLNLPLIRVDAP